MTKDELSADYLFPWHVPSYVINLFSLSSMGIFILYLGADGWTWHMESQEFGPWIQDLGFSSDYFNHLLLYFHRKCVH
jgi:hypothetical protein